MPPIKRPRRKLGARPYKKPSTKRVAAQVPPAQPNIDQQESPFLALPIEIRWQIYSYLTNLLPPSKNAPERSRLEKGRKSLMSVCRQVSEEWIPYFYRSTTIIGSRMNQPSDFGNLYLKTLDHYKLRHIRKIAYRASPDDKGSPEFSEMKALLTLVGKFETELHSLVEVKLHARYTSYSRCMWSIGLTPDRAAMTIWAWMGWGQFTRTLQGRTRSGALRGWDAEKEVFVLMWPNPHSYRPVELVLKLTKPENLDELMAEGPGVEVYKLSVSETQEIAD